MNETDTTPPEAINSDTVNFSEVGPGLELVPGQVIPNDLVDHQKRIQELMQQDSGLTWEQACRAVREEIGKGEDYYYGYVY